MGQTGHHSVQKGKRVKIHFRDGRTRIAKFIEKKGRYITFNYGKELAADIKTLTIYKPTH